MPVVVCGKNVGEPPLSRELLDTVLKSLDWGLSTVPPEESEYPGSGLPRASASAVRSPHFGPNPSREPFALNRTPRSCPSALRDGP